MALFARVTANTSFNATNCYLKFITKDQRSWCFPSLLKNTFITSKCQQRNSRYTHSKVNKNNQTSKLAEKTKNEITGEDFLSKGSYDELVVYRRKQAKRTIIVQVQSPDSHNDLYSYCSSFGSVESMHHYTVLKTSHFFIVEFKNVESRLTLLESATHINNLEIVPASSNIFWFRNASRKTKKITIENNNSIPLLIKSQQPTEQDINSMLMKKKYGISEQIKDLYDMLKLDDTESRLRFLTAHQMENSLISLFPNIRVLPFGSSVNGFGKRGCDLDLLMELDSDKKEKVGSRLVFHTKSCIVEQRAQTRRTMEAISGIMVTFIPGINNVRKILMARVPIIKYDHSLTGLECDLSMTNMTAVYMSELLFLYGEIHESVRPLVFTIRRWAHAVGITNSSPGNWITNFSLSLLVLFHLQQKNVLPSLNMLKKLARPSDVRVTYPCVDCTFIRDPNLVPKPETINEDSLESLLSDFFNFYANFDFSSQAISLSDGLSLYKKEPAPLYICNPLEESLNVSKNVNVTEVTRFIHATRNAATLMNEGIRNDSRGLLDIFAEKQLKYKKIITVRNEKRVRISELFDTQQSSNNINNDELQINESRQKNARRR